MITKGISIVCFCIFILSAASCPARDEIAAKDNATRLRAEIVLLKMEKEARIVARDTAQAPALRDKNITRIRNARRSDMKELIGMGDPVVDMIVERIHKENADGIYMRILANTLSKIQTPEAVRARMELLKKSDDNIGYQIAARVPPDVYLDTETFSKMTEQLARGHYREKVLDTLAADLSGDFMKEKVRAVVKSITSIQSNPRSLIGFRGFEASQFGSIADNLFTVHVTALAKMVGVDDAIRAEIDILPGGIARDCLIIALGRRGDMQTSRKPMIAFLKNKENRTLPWLRMKCLAAFSIHGGPQDLEFLREISLSDPYHTEEYLLLPKCEKWGEEYINLTKEQIESPDTDFAPKQTIFDEKQKPIKTSYPTRTVAQGAINAIEARLKEK